MPQVEQPKTFSGSTRSVGTLRYIGSCTEIHDLQLMPGVRRLRISGYDTDTCALAVDLPEAGWWLAPTREDEPEAEALPRPCLDASIPFPSIRSRAC